MLTHMFMAKKESDVNAVIPTMMIIRWHQTSIFRVVGLGTCFVFSLASRSSIIYKLEVLKI